MTQRPLRVEKALRALPEVDDLHLLRGAVVGASREDGERRWAASAAYSTVDARLTDIPALEGQVAALADAARARTEASVRHAIAALRALEHGDEPAAARALVAAGEVQERAGRWAEAAACYERAREIGRRPRDRRAEGLALRRLGRVARQAGELERSLEMYRAALAVAEAQRDVEGMVVACQGLGNVQVDQGRWADARAWYLRGVELLPVDGHAADRVHLCNAMAVVERRMGNLDESAAWLDRGAAAAGGAGDASGAGYVLNARGMLHLARGDNAAAEAAFRRALEAQLEPAARTGVMVNLADPLLRAGRLPDAERVAREAERLAIRHNVLIKLPDVYRTLGAIAQARGDGEAFLFFEQALAVCREHRLPPFETAATQQRYGEFEVAMGLRESGTARLRAALEIYRSLGAELDARSVAAALAAAGWVDHTGGARAASGRGNDDDAGRTDGAPATEAGR